MPDRQANAAARGSSGRHGRHAPPCGRRESILPELTAADKKTAPAGANRELEPPKSITLKHNSIRTIHSCYFVITRRVRRYPSTPSVLHARDAVSPARPNPMLRRNLFGRPKMQSDHKPVRDGWHLALWFPRFRCGTAPLGKRSRTNMNSRQIVKSLICYLFDPYQFEMLLPQCRHDFSESCRLLISAGC
jgi:hypothetical protein